MKVAIVGTGSVAQGCYLPFLHKQPDVELVYFSRTRAKAEACAAQFGGTVCGDLVEVMNRDPTVVFVLTNETTRADVLAELARNTSRWDQYRASFAKSIGAYLHRLRQGEQPAVELSPSEDFIRRDIRAVGSWFYQVGEFPEMLRLYRQGLAVERLVTHVLPFAEASQAFVLFATGRTGKVLLRHEEV